MMALLQWREPLWLLLALLPLALLVGAYLLRRWQHHDYADVHLRAWVISEQRVRQIHRWRQRIFTLLAWLCFAIAMAGPRIPVSYLDTQQQYTSQLYVVVDLSASMTATDIQPSRLERAKLELLDLSDRLQRTQLGLIVYAAQPHVLTPPTTDKVVLRQYIKTLRADLLPTAGSQTLAAIDFTSQQFDSANNISKAILLISDGEHHLNAQQLTDTLHPLAERLKQNRIHLYTLGVGSRHGAAILTSDQGWLSDDNQAVISKLNSDFLQQLADLGNGQFSIATDDDSDWQSLYDQGIAQLPFESLQQQQDESVQWRELYTGFIIAGMLLLLIAIWHIKPQPIQAALLLPIYCVTLFGYSEQSLAADNSYAHAYEQYQRGDYVAAQNAFASIPGYTARFAEASSAYQLQEYKQAIPLFVQAVLQATTDQQRIDAIFNLANTYFKLAQYEQAGTLYADVLRYQPEHRAATINREYALALIEKESQKPSVNVTREGTGPRTADAPPNLDIERGRLSISDSQSNTETTPASSDTSPQQSAQILLQQSRPASEQIEYSNDPSWTYDITTLHELQARHKPQDIDETILWQRLFEIEEGFMAEQEQPKQLPGIKPW